MKQLGYRFRVIPSSVPEKINPFHGNPGLLARALSLKKAEYVSRRVKRGLVIGFDTIVVSDGRILGKPGSRKEAFRFLNLLSGKTHRVITGFTIIDAETGKKITRSVSTRVAFKRLSVREIGDYIKSGEPMGKAGAYAIQGKGAAFVKSIRGDYFNVVGLPLYHLSENLGKFGSSAS